MANYNIQYKEFRCLKLNCEQITITDIRATFVARSQNARMDLLCPDCIVANALRSSLKRTHLTTYDHLSVHFHSQTHCHNSTLGDANGHQAASL
jgi:hypothetical protein